MENQIREQFEFLKDNSTVYFDNSACCLIPKCVCDAVDNYFRYESVNAGRGIYKLAYKITSKVEETRRKVAEFIGAEADEIIFTKNTTEGINLVANSFVRSQLKAGDEIVISGSEHNSNYLPWLNLSKEMGIKLTIVPLKDFKPDMEAFKKAITQKTCFVAFNLVCNTLGYKINAKELIKHTKKMGAKVLIDASQAVAHFKINVKDLDCDFLALSSYKIFAPSGCGVLFARTELQKQMQPIFYGGGMVTEIDDGKIIPKEPPYKFEAGTLPIGNIIGLGEAVSFVGEVGWDYIETKENQLKTYLINGLKSLSEEVIIYNKTPDLPIVIFNIKDIHPHDAATLYDRFNICLRAGNHCGILVESLIGQPTLRVSLSFYNTIEEIDRLITATKEIIDFFKKLKGEI